MFLRYKPIFLKKIAPEIRAFPAEGLNVPIWILGSSVDSAALATAYGSATLLPDILHPNKCCCKPLNFTEKTLTFRIPFGTQNMACVNVIAADKPNRSVVN
jgi:hypothetical protein